MLVLVTSSVIGAYIIAFCEVSPKAREFPGDAGIKGAFFPLGGQFFPEYQRGKFSRLYIWPFPTGETFKRIRLPPTVYNGSSSRTGNTRVVTTLLLHGRNPRGCTTHPSLPEPAYVAEAGRRGASVCRSISRLARDRRKPAEWLRRFMVFLSRARAGLIVST